MITGYAGFVPLRNIPVPPSNIGQRGTNSKYADLLGEYLPASPPKPDLASTHTHDFCPKPLSTANTLKPAHFKSADSENQPKTSSKIASKTQTIFHGGLPNIYPHLQPKNTPKPEEKQESQADPIPKSLLTLYQRSHLSQFNPSNSTRSKSNFTSNFRETGSLKAKKDPNPSKNSEKFLWPQKFFDASSYAFYFGKLGEDPYSKMPQDSKGPIYNSADDLLKGSSKLSGYVPGYTGHIPVGNEFNFKVRQQVIEKEVARKTYLKDNILSNYSRNIPGYSGHKDKF